MGMGGGSYRRCGEFFRHPRDSVARRGRAPRMLVRRGPRGVADLSREKPLTSHAGSDLRMRVALVG